MTLSSVADDKKPRQPPYDGTLGTFVRRVHDLQRRFIEGSLDPEETLKVIQALSEGRAIVSPYSDEVVKSDRTYPADFRMLSIEEQVTAWTKFRSSLEWHGPLEPPAEKLPAGIDGWLVIPKPREFGSSYQESARHILRHLNWKLRLVLPAEGLDWMCRPERLMRTDRTAEVFQYLERTQKKGDFLMFPMQSGMLHRGQSVRRARFCFRDELQWYEFGLGPYEVACFLLTHPNRLQSEADLFIRCAGAKSRDLPHRFTSCPSFSIYLGSGENAGKPRFTGGADYKAFPAYGSASGFIPDFPFE